MTLHTIPHDADLISLVLLSKQWEREDALAALEADLAAVWPKRRAHRTRNSKRSRKGAETRRERANAALKRVTAPLGLRPEPVPVSAIRQVSAFADDWDQCPHCHFIAVACDCDAPQGERH